MLRLLQLQSRVLALGQEQFHQFDREKARVNSFQIAIENMQVFRYELPESS